MPPLWGDARFHMVDFVRCMAVVVRWCCVPLRRSSVVRLVILNYPQPSGLLLLFVLYASPSFFFVFCGGGGCFGDGVDFGMRTSV